ncbi:GntR family transcriptional regulator [Roseicyclus sp.]|uniref:GntR family transcriptional regulator n=1 Tax=Roseicyclus sp. TaxID=1914329 RepID=UPI001BCF6CD4|nr:GntR family transcriptional regulator [Roseicyclus sp.]
MARVPLYKATETEMIRRIKAGEWAVGLRLPNEFGLAEEFGVSQGTMRRALITLEGLGLLARKPGRGTVVCAPAAAQDHQENSVPAPQLRDASGAPVILDVYRARSATRGADDEELALFGTTRLATLERIFHRNGQRAARDLVTIPEALLPVIDEDAGPDLAELLQDAGLVVAHIEEDITAAVTTMSASVALACDRYTALLVLTRIARDAKGNPIARQRLQLIADGMRYGA